MGHLFSLGELYVSDFLAAHETPQSPKVELTLVRDELLGNVRLSQVAPKETMYGKYWYRSGMNMTMTVELRQIVDAICSIINFKENDIWLDIACNDGTLLKHVPDTFIKIGIDPADDSFLNESSKVAHCVVQDYFSSAVFKNCRFGRERARVVTSIAMFYDLEDPIGFAREVNEVLRDDGIWVLQLSYTPLMLEQLAFDNICHEHVYYYALEDLAKVLDAAGFEVFDVGLNDVNGGSFRVYAVKKEAERSRFGTQPSRDVAAMRVKSLLCYEQVNQVMSTRSWETFFHRIEALKNEVVAFLLAEKSKGKTIWAYGASTKGNTLLQYFGLDNAIIDGIAEKSTYKFGLRTVGTDIPIFSEAEMRDANPDYLLILPWHFISEFKIRESDYLANGGKFVVPCPKFEIIEG